MIISVIFPYFHDYMKWRFSQSRPRFRNHGNHTSLLRVRQNQGLEISVLIPDFILLMLGEIQEQHGNFKPLQNTKITWRTSGSTQVSLMFVSFFSSVVYITSAVAQSWCKHNQRLQGEQELSLERYDNTSATV